MDVGMSMRLLLLCVPRIKWLIVCMVLLASSIDGWI
jgi:hypothetical protein